MNIVLFESSELSGRLPRADPRVHHVLTVLRRSVGDNFDVGQVNGPRGKATLREISEDGVQLLFTWASAHAPPPPTRLTVGFPRPQTARDILRDATTLGVTEINFVHTHRSDPNYPNSSLWQKGAWRRQLLTGAAQAFDPFIPEVTWHETLAESVQREREAGGLLLGLDVYGAHPQLAELDLPAPAQPCTLLIGPERGWDAQDRSALQESGVTWFSLGARVLRTETAVVAGLALISAARARAGK